MDLNMKIAILIIIIFIIYVRFENKNLKISHYTVKSKNIPKEFDGSKFIVLADLHNNSFGKDNEILINTVKAINPDFIIIAGDMIVGNDNPDYAIVSTLLTELSFSYPIYYGFGNHEQRIMPGGKKPDKHFNEFKMKIEKLGVQFLNNRSITISKNNDKITISGLTLDNKYFKKFKQIHMEPDFIQNLVGISNKQCYNILIAHNPVFFKNYMEWGADLVLSGHVHGGIIRLPKIGGMISPQYKLFPTYDAGKFKEENKVMLVSRGLGTHTIKVRVFNPPELLVVKLEHLK